MKLLKTFAFAALLSVSVSPRAARAQEWTRQSFLLPKGGFEITGTPVRPELMRINASRDNSFKPVEFPVDLFWGISDDVMIGVTHEHGLRFNTGPNDHKVYNDVGFGSVIWLAGGRDYEVDLHLGLPLHRLSPDLLVGAQVGILGRANVSEKVALFYDPSVYIGFNRRSIDNGDYLNLPLWVYFQPTRTIAPFVGTALEGALDHFGDHYRIPLEGGVLIAVADGVQIGGMLRFPNALGKDGTLDWRELGFLAQFRF